jgi:hypothetical protein
VVAGRRRWGWLYRLGGAVKTSSPNAPGTVAASASLGTPSSVCQLASDE